MLMQKLIELLAPASCVGCGREGDWLCVDCLREQVSIPEPACYRCEKLTSDGSTCNGCREPGGLFRVISGGLYRGPVKELIRVLKFKRGRSASRVAARLILVQLGYAGGIDAVTAVPISPSRYREHGYNQSELIAKLIARQIGVPHRTTLMRSTSAHQVGRGRSERLAAIQGSFQAIRRLDGQRILVVDDVLTTGATLAECAAVLSAAGAASVHGATVARR